MLSCLSEGGWACFVIPFIAFAVLFSAFECCVSRAAEKSGIFSNYLLTNISKICLLLQLRRLNRTKAVYPNETVIVGFGYLPQQFPVRSDELRSASAENAEDVRRVRCDVFRRPNKTQSDVSRLIGSKTEQSQPVRLNQ